MLRGGLGEAQKQAGQRDRTQHCDHGECRAPAEKAADEVTERDTDDGRDRHPRRDQRHRPAAPLRRGDGDRDGKRCRHAQPGADRHQHARGQQQRVARSHHSEQVSSDEGQERERQHGAAVDIVQRHRQDRRADGMGEGVCGDQLSGGRDRNREVAGDRRQKTCNHKAFGTNRERCQGQPEHAHCE